MRNTKLSGMIFLSKYFVTHSAPCLSLFRLLQQNTGLGLNNKDLFFSVLDTGIPRSGHQNGWVKVFFQDMSLSVWPQKMVGKESFWHFFNFIRH